MPNLSEDLKTPIFNGDIRGFSIELRRIINTAWRDLSAKFNSITQGRISGFYSTTAPPTTGEWMKGDEVRNSNPQELGDAGSKYVIRGWICLTSGEPGVWVEQRFLTGN